MPETDFKAAWQELKNALIMNKATGEGKIPGYINIDDQLCFMGVLERRYAEGKVNDETAERHPE